MGILGYLGLGVIAVAAARLLHRLTGAYLSEKKREEQSHE